MLNYGDLGYLSSTQDGILNPDHQYNKWTISL